MRINISATLQATIDIILAPPTQVNDLKGTINMSTVTLKWTDPTTRVDGSALAPTEIASIDIFDTAASTPTVPIGNILGGVGTFTTGVLSVGDHTFTVVVNDTTGHKSAASNPFTATIAAISAAPSAVADLSGTVNP